MKNPLTLLIGIVVVAVLVAATITFQVRYDEVAVLTTFEKPKDRVIKAGIYLKAPYPIQAVTKYSQKIQILEDQLEEIQTADGKAVIMKMYLVWRIDDPLAFFRSVKSVRNAEEEQLNPLLRNLRSQITRYRFDQLVNPDPDKLALLEIEQACAERLRETLASLDYGIEVVQVGIRRILLPESTTEKVFEQMRKTRERLAEAARAEGEAQAGNITGKAEAAQRQILAFAERRAQEIRSIGDEEAANYIGAFGDNPELAIFLGEIDSLKKMLSHNTTFILDATKQWFLRQLREDTIAINE